MTIIRASAVAAWSACEKMALNDSPVESRIHVAAWVGTAAHTLVADGINGELAEISGDLPEMPPRVIFDRETPTAEHARRHALWCAREALRVLEAEGWWIAEAEMPVRGPDTTGTLDLLVIDDDGTEAVLDLKTGYSPGAAAWLQVGAYLALLDRSNVTLGGVLHSPRTAKGATGRGSLELREAAPLIAAWQDRRSRISAVLDGAPPLATPGQHCARCSVPCIIRVR